MTDMIERAGIAADDEMANQFEKGVTLNRPPNYAAVGRAALLAALDPEDEALVKMLSDAWERAGIVLPPHLGGKAQAAVAAITALKAHCAQGEL